MCTKSWRFKVGLAVAGVVIVAATAFAFANILTVDGTLTLVNYTKFEKPDFSDYSGPATVRVAAFSMDPGEATSWHYHEGLTYVVLEQGTVTEDEGCGMVQTFSAGAGFVETPGRVHRVINTGSDKAVFYWSTMYPSSVKPSIPAAEPSCR